jgi:aspartyl-tRNA(Asn)/glutamyl-tRNA(Gln) amidotransferase subunit A
VKSAQPAFPTLAGTADLIRRREVSPVEVTAGLLERIDRLDGALHAYITVTADLALRQARRAEAELAAGTYRGPLHGIPIALKDLYDTAGVRTTADSRVLEHNVPDADAQCVTRLYDAGAVLLGKLALSEFATGSVVEGPFPAARNPWNPDHVPGASSSGSGAAVAAGLCLGALGSDTGGSIRIPAGYCGVAGIRPTYGRVSRRGVVSLSWSLDTAGPLAPTVTDCALLLQALAGYDPLDPASAAAPVPDFSAGLRPDLRGLVVGVDRAHFFGPAVEAQSRAAVETALGVLRGLGAEVREIELPLLDVAGAALNTIHLSEAHTYHETRIRARPDLYGPALRAYFRLGALAGVADYLRAQQVREKIRRQMLAALREVDVIAGPTTGSLPPRLDAPDTAMVDRFARQSLTAPFSLTGVPAMSVPCGFSADGLPIGLQLAGRPFEEATVFRAAFAYEQATRWHTMHPQEGA